MKGLKLVSYPDYTVGYRVIGQNDTSLVHHRVGNISRWVLLSRDDITAVVLNVLLALLLIFPIESGSANVITDWDMKAIAVAAPAPSGAREMAIVHIAMFDAVNSIERRYRPYLIQIPALKNISQDAAAATAAGTVLIALHPDKAGELKVALASYLAVIPDSDGKLDGIKVGEAAAAKVLEARVHDGADAPDAYRLKTKPGVYVPTSTMVGSAWPNLKPFVLRSPSQFRPGPPISLESNEWTADYNEIKEYGGKTSTKRLAQQTETARFWLTVGPPMYHQITRQVIAAKSMSIVDSARFMALYSVALTDAYISVFDAKYHYDFWRPITAIRNADIDGNPETTPEANWEPIDNTPLHPEYPCAHCIESGAASAVIEYLLGSTEIPEVSMTSPTAPGVTHRWANLASFEDEIAEARICAGFHYRFSTRVGAAMGHKVGRYVVENVMQPVAPADEH
jgi:PAP2 superfamily